MTKHNFEFNRDTNNPFYDSDRELLQIWDGPYMYGLTPTYVSGEDNEDHTSSQLPKLYFDRPLLQFDMRTHSTIKEIAIIATSAWVLYKTEMTMLYRPDPRYDRDINLNVWEQIFHRVCMDRRSFHH